MTWLAGHMLVTSLLLLQDIPVPQQHLQASLLIIKVWLSGGN
jgi:hypothetical protein